jgi:hypothetical protein
MVSSYSILIYSLKVVKKLKQLTRSSKLIAILIYRGGKHVLRPLYSMTPTDITITIIPVTAKFVAKSEYVSLPRGHFSIDLN